MNKYTPEQIEKLKTEITGLEATKVSLDREISVREGKLAQLADKITALSAKIQSVTAEKNELVEKNAQLETDTRNAKDVLNSINLDKSQATLAVKDLKKQIIEKENVLSDLLKEITKTGLALTAIQTEKSTAEIQLFGIAKRERRLDVKEGQIKGMYTRAGVGF